jgi:hypothetical protein
MNCPYDLCVFHSIEIITAIAQRKLRLSSHSGGIAPVVWELKLLRFSADKPA